MPIKTERQKSEKRTAVKEAMIYAFKNPHVYCAANGFTKHDMLGYLKVKNKELKNLYYLIKELTEELLQQELIYCCNPPESRPRYRINKTLDMLR